MTLAALLVFGYVKGRFTGTRPWRSALQTTLIGGLAAAAAFLIARRFHDMTRDRPELRRHWQEARTGPSSPLTLPGRCLFHPASRP